MIPWGEVLRLPQTATVAEAEEQVRRSGRTRIPVEGADGTVLGFVHAKDLLYLPRVGPGPADPGATRPPAGGAGSGRPARDRPPRHAAAAGPRGRGAGCRTCALGPGNHGRHQWRPWWVTSRTRRTQAGGGPDGRRGGAGRLRHETATLKRGSGKVPPPMRRWFVALFVLLALAGSTISVGNPSAGAADIEEVQAAVDEASQGSPTPRAGLAGWSSRSPPSSTRTSRPRPGWRSWRRRRRRSSSSSTPRWRPRDPAPTRRGPHPAGNRRRARPGRPAG